MFWKTGAAFLAFGIIASSALAEERVRVEVDKALILRLDEPAATIVIGNPMIADASVQGEKMLVVTGRSFGTTNLIALDRKGNEIMTRTLDVQYSSKALVTVHKGPARQSLTCAPVCETTLNVGDSTAYFEGVQKQIESRGGLSAGRPATN